ncbi:MAG TPA: hypothetical protein PLB51_00515 [Candidatus Paceibacterota bacterium]|nr:hypothetical protein [Candidatus Paceibacterota bacterium]
MKNKIIVLSLGAILLPSIVHAEWWNPRTWFVQNEIKNIPELRVDAGDLKRSVNEHNEVPETTATSSSVIVPESTVIERAVIKTVTVPVDRIVEKIVIKPDQSVIDENNSLKLKIKELQGTPNQCLIDLEKLQARIKQLEASLTQAEAQKKATLAAIASMDLEISRVRAGDYDKEICTSNPSSCNENWQKSPTIRPPQVLLDKKIAEFEVLKAKLQLELIQM